VACNAKDRPRSVFLHELRDPAPLILVKHDYSAWNKKLHLQGLYQLNDVHLRYKCFVIPFLENRRVLHYHYGPKRKHQFQNQMDSFRKHYNYYSHFVRCFCFPFLIYVADIVENKLIA